MDGQLEYQALKDHVNMTGAVFNGGYLKTNLHVGVAF